MRCAFYFKYFLLLIFLGCFPKVGSVPKDYRTGLMEFAHSFAKSIENGKRVVVMNFNSLGGVTTAKGIPSLNVYLARIFSSYLTEEAGSRFSVIDRERGKETVEEDLKYEVGGKDLKALNEEFQCDYYVFGGYILSASRRLEFVDILLTQGPRRICCKSGSFNLTEEEYNDLKQLACGDVIERLIENLIQLLKNKKAEITNRLIRLGIEVGIKTMEALLNEYKNCKADKDCRIYEQIKSKIISKYHEVKKLLH